MNRYSYSTRPAVPVEALRLNEDIHALKQAIRLLYTVDAYNMAADPDHDTVWLCVQKLKMCQRYAEEKLRREYLDPRKKRLNEQRSMRSN